MAAPAPRWTARYRATGAVQGVGFRPFVHRLAHELGLGGFVRNDAAGAEIEAVGTESELASFEQRLRAELPAPARLDELICIARQATESTGAGFRIEHSATAGAKRAAVLPDLALCADCLRELRDPADRRFRHPFITCTRCGPRFSIITGIPYDRPNTTMAGFPLCADCRAEYEDPSDRRFHAQPIACPACGPRIAWWDAQGQPLAEREAVWPAAVRALQEGRILAVKGLGGFHLMCDARQPDVVATLRERKQREAKPLALMVRDVEQARALCTVSEAEAALLASPASPIVLLCRCTNPGFALAEGVAPGHPTLGLMLPYTPLHRLLLDAVGFPVVATSGNLSDEPICTDELEAVKRLAGIADFFLVHDRPIARPVDDSVVRVVAGRPLLLRRSRGYAPEPIPCPGPWPETDIVLAVGAHLKNTVALRRGMQVVLSQHLGDLDSLESRQAFARALEDLPRLYEATPDRIACDLHPDYASTRQARAGGRPVTAIQHHHAHIIAVLAEHGVEEEVLGVAWDGTGYGTDGTAWGGEFLLATRSAFTRFAHLRTFCLPGGDAAAREPRRSALGLLHELGETRRAASWFTPSEFRLLNAALAQGVQAPRTSSMGRLFDAAAALSGRHADRQFEGQAAMELECAAGDLEADRGYPLELRAGVLDWAPAVRELLRDVEAGVSRAVISARFHRGLVEAIVTVARAAGRPQVALGGGCFQNARLLSESVAALRAAGFTPWWPQRVPPNDGGIAFGQAAFTGWRPARL